MNVLFYFDVFAIVSCFLSCFFTLLFFDNIKSGYELILCFPVIYLISYFVLKPSNAGKIALTKIFYLILQWLRCVLLPVLITISGDNCGVSYLYPSSENLTYGCILIVYELIITSVFLKYFDGQLSITKKVEKFNLCGNPLIYVCFCVLVFCIWSIYGSSTPISYIAISNADRIGSSQSSFSTLIQYLSILAFMFIFLTVVDWCNKRYQASKQEKYIFLAILAALNNICLIIGEHRSMIIYSTVCSIYILSAYFKEKKNFIFITTGLTSFFVLSMMSIYKFLGVFMYSSYTEALMKSSLDIGWYSATFQNYFMGPEQVAINIQFGDNFQLPITFMLFDFLRSVFPLSMLLKGTGDITSVIFNHTIYGGIQDTGYILSSIGYGYIYLGIALSPIMSIMSLMACYIAELKMYKAETSEMKYIWCYICARFAFLQLYNIPSTLMPVSIIFVLGSICVFMAGRIRLRGS